MQKAENLFALLPPRPVLVLVQKAFFALITIILGVTLILDVFC